ncbi:MAG: PBSX family phage terminase large subunit, partial [Clostridia bacterium]|nr:PBSX family phage terminase large subunit [Clostridia bacterium]
RNVLVLLSQLVGKNNFSYSLSKKEGILFGRKIYFEGVSDSRAESKIRGMTLMGAYCDELTLMSESFFSMLLSRLSEKGAALFATTNPDSPYHWLKRNYIDRAKQLDMLVETFLLTDNTFLDKKYVESLKKEYTGVYYDRYILGKWKAAEGIIYRSFAENPQNFTVPTPSSDEIAFATIGVDFGGNKSAHAFICTGFSHNMDKITVLDEFYIKEQISPKKLEDYFITFAEKCLSLYNIYDVYCDNAETTLINGLTNAVIDSGLAIDIRNARKKPVTQRIRFISSMMSHGRFFITENCPHLAEALSTAVWDDSQGTDKRLDNGSINVDSLDAMEYSIEPYMEDF